MKIRRPYDLVVIGAEPAGLAAAACAARQGANVAVIRAAEAQGKAPTSPGIPDFVWRRLDLHESGLDAKPVGARVSLFDNGRNLATHASAKKTREALESAEIADHNLWTDFTGDISRRWSEGEEMATLAAAGRANGRPGSVLSAIASPAGTATIERLTSSTRSVLDDFFANDELKTHLASVALTPFGLGGDEAGSALALAALSEPAAWRVKTKARGPTLIAVLEEVARASGVEIFDAAVRLIEAGEEKHRALTLEDGEILKARNVMAASEAAAARAGVPVTHALAPLARREGAVADVRVKFAKAPPSPTGDKDAVFYIAESIETLSEARDAAMEGRLPDRPPISFEFMRDEIVVHAPYCPAVLRTEGEARDWTEQDRQALGRMIVARLAPFLNGATQTVRRIDVRVSQAGARQGEIDAGSVIAPPPAHDVIGAAAKLALELIRGE